MTERRVFRKELYQSRAVVLLVAVVMVCAGPLFALDAAPSGKVIPLTNISPERGREFLGRLKIGTASRLGGSSALLVTAEPGELQKAVALLNLVDTRTQFGIKELGPASVLPLPSNAQLANAVGGLTIGTFANPPQDKGKLRAIVDVHNGVVVAIAPVFQLENIRLAVERGPEALPPRKSPAKPLCLEAVDQTIQAITMAELSPEVSSPQSLAASASATFTPAQDSSLSASDSFPADHRQAGGSARADERQEMQEKLQEMRAHADELQARRRSVAQSGTPSERTAPADPPPPVANPPAQQPNTQPAEPAPPVESRQAGESRAEVAEPAPPIEPTAAESTAPQPIQVVPSPAPTAQTQPAAMPVAQPQTRPQPQDTPIAASPAVPEAQPAAVSPEPTEASDGEETRRLSLPPRLPVIDLLDLVGKHLSLSYVYNPDEVKGEVTLKLNGSLEGTIKVKDLYSLLEQTLKANNLVMTRHKGNIVTIVPATRAGDADPILMDGTVSDIAAGDTVVTRHFTLKHIDTTSAKNLLDTMRLGLETTPIAERHMLMVTTYACRLDRIERLLQIVDQPGEPRKFRFRQLRYTMAKVLAEKVKAMAEQMLDSVTITVAEPDLSFATARQPGESDIAYRTRLAQLNAVRQAQQAAQRAARAQLGQPETRPGVYLDADERTNRVLMIGVEEQLGIVEQLVNALDVEQQDLRALQLYRMKFVDADEVAQKLYELRVISQMPQTSASLRNMTSPRITTPLPGQPRPTTVPATLEAAMAPSTEVTEKGLVEEPQVVVVEATNSLLVNATAEQHAKIANIIEYVDSETLLDEIPYKIYPLENSSPKHLAEVLESLIQETVEQEKEGGKIEKTVISRDERIKIVPDPNTYSLIVYANKKNQEWIANLVEQLDKRRPQVLIDVTLVEVTKSDVFSFDLNLIRSSPDLASTSAISGVKPGADALGKFVQTGGGALSAFYGDDQIQALLETMQSKNYGRVLAKPKLLVNDNQQGLIETKDTTYVEVTSAVPVTSGGAGNQQNMIQTSQSFQSYEAGITLDITPHISEGDLLQLNIVLTRSDFLKTLPSKPPDTRTNQVDTAVTLPNGSTVILGGLLKMNQSKGGAKVPILGDLPLVGGLFRSINNEDNQSKLYVFVKAEIIRAAEGTAQSMKDLELLSDRNRAAFEKHELEFQKYEDWPGIKPRRVDPPKVLDAQ